jgi:hypothetical protein
MDTKTMTQRVLFVDLENVQKIDVSSLVLVDMRVMVFYGITEARSVCPSRIVVLPQDT